MQPTYSPNSVTRHVVSLITQGPSPHSRRLSRILSSIRRPAASNTRRKPSSLPPEGCIELDSHVDTIILGANCIILSHTGQSCEVMPYSDTYDAITYIQSLLAQLYGLPHMMGTSTSSYSTKLFGWATLYNTCWSILTSSEHRVQPYRTTPLHHPH